MPDGTDSLYILYNTNKPQKYHHLCKLIYSTLSNTLNSLYNRNDIIIERKVLW